MSDDPRKNRIIYGSALFGLLIIANLIVHGRRATQKTPAKTEVVTVASTANLPETPISKVDSETASLTAMLEDLKRELALVPSPYPNPEFEIVLRLPSRDFVRWEVPAIAPPRIPTDQDEPALPTPEREQYTIIGEFDIGGKKKLMIRSEDTVFLVNGSKDAGGFELVSDENNLFVVKDNEGNSHELLYPPPETNESIDRITNVLLGNVTVSGYRLTEDESE